MVTPKASEGAAPSVAARSNQPLIEITATCDMLTHSPVKAAVLTTRSTAGDGALIAFARQAAWHAGIALIVESRASALILRFHRDGP